MSDVFQEEIETGRLELEQFCRERIDPVDVFEFFSAADESVDEAMAFLTWTPDETPKDTRDRLVDAEEAWEDCEQALYAVRPGETEDETGEFAGNASLKVDWERRVGDVGLWLRPPFWRRGYAGEVGYRLLELAFERLSLEVVVAWHTEDNERARGMMEKYTEPFGGQYDGVVRNGVVVDGEPRDKHLYTVTKTQWKESTGAAETARQVA